MNKREKRLKFLELIFDPEDQIAWGDTPITCNKPRDPYPFILNTNDELFCLHALKKWRKGENVTKITTLLFECDDKEIDQEAILLESGIPFTTMVYSGNKSYHMLLRMEEPFSSKDWHQAYWHGISKVLKSYGFKADDNARLLTQITRLPESTRNKTGEVQSLNHIRKRVSQSEIDEWLLKHNVVIEEPKEYEPIQYTPGANDAYSNLEKFKRAIGWTEKNHGVYSTYMTSGAYMWLFYFSINCYKLDLHQDAAISLANIEWGHKYTGSNGSGMVETPIQNGYKDATKKMIQKYEL